MPAEQKAIEMMAKVIGKKLPKVGLPPEPELEDVSPEDAAKALAAFETKPKHRSELVRRLESLAIGAGLKTSARKAKIASSVGHFQKSSGSRFRVFELDGWTHIIRVESTKDPEK